MIAVENVGHTVNRNFDLGRVRLAVADSPGSKQLVDFARTTVEPGSLIRTDGARMFRVLATEGYTTRHLGLQLARTWHVDPAGTAPSASLLKRWNAGTTTTGSTVRAPAVLPRRRFTFRFNRRRSAARGMSSTGCCNRASTPTRTASRPHQHPTRADGARHLRRRTHAQQHIWRILNSWVHLSQISSNMFDSLWRPQRHLWCWRGRRVGAVENAACARRLARPLMCWSPVGRRRVG